MRVEIRTVPSQPSYDWTDLDTCGTDYPLTATETQLDFWGIYEPPLGAVGKAMNAIIGHRIAEASVHRFIVCCERSGGVAIARLFRRYPATSS
jgi:hypothetical protein